jgi:hypothetical protein
MAKPTDWEILAVVFLRRLGGKVEIHADEIAGARELFDSCEHETMMVAYEASRLAPELVTVELRSRSRAVLVGEALTSVPEGAEI